MAAPSPDGSDSVPQSSDAFFAHVYEELRKIAHGRLRGEQAGYTLQTTELVHEAYLRLGPGSDAPWQSRRQFFAAAAEAMRRILIDRARAKSSVKRGGDGAHRRERVSLQLEEIAQSADDRDPDLVLELDRLIEVLAKRDARAAEIVKLRFYAGLSIAEIAATLELSNRTVLRDWEFARVWLYGELAKG